MATVTGLTKQRMEQIEAQCIVDGAVILGDLILTRNDGSTFNAGRVLGEKGDAANQSVEPLDLTVPLRDYGGRVKTGDPIDPDDAVPKSVVDALHAIEEIPAGQDLDDYVETGLYSQTLSIEASNGTNYPQGIAGLLQVVRETSSGNMVWQFYTPYGVNSDVAYRRGRYNNVWSAWYKIDNEDTGWVTTGIAFTTSASFTLGTYALRRIGRQVQGHVYITYTAATTLTGGVDGNMGDQNGIFVLPTGWRKTNTVYYHPIISRPGYAQFVGRYTGTNGAVDLVAASFSGHELTQNTQLVVSLSYFID